MSLKTYLKNNISILYILFECYVNNNINNDLIYALTDLKTFFSNHNYFINTTSQEINTFFDNMIQDNYKNSYYF